LYSRINDFHALMEIVLRKLGAGMTAEAIVGGHPRLTLEDIRAAGLCRRLFGR
jgi:uncharacterized protein (DUF433 family)